MVILLSLAAAIGIETWLGRFAHESLTLIVAAAAVAGFAGGLLRPRIALPAILTLGYAAPALFALVLGLFRLEFLLAWSAALTGFLLADRERLRWSFPPQFRAPLVLWSLTIALAWPIVCLREIDFTRLEILDRYNIPNTGIGGPPSQLAAWIIDTAIVHLLGLLWLDWLFRHVQPDGTRLRFLRHVALPLAVSAAAGSLLAIYQGTIDLTFLSGGIWTSVARAPGPLMDANAFGMIAALWSAGLLAFAGRLWWLRIAASVVCWGGLWMTGSRTALLAAAVALAAAGFDALVGAGGRRRAVCAAAAAAAAAILLAATAVTLAPTEGESPLTRMRRNMPADLTGSALHAFAREMWNRNGYGLAATGLIAERPIAGHGLGTFNLFGADYSQRHDTPLPPDNAQNWWRHQIAELGLLGAVGPLAWTAVFVMFLLRTRGHGEARRPAVLLKGALLGFGLASLVGVPGQSLLVTITFWTMVFWYIRLVEPAVTTTRTAMPAAAWAVVWALALAHAGVTLALARGDLRPAVRAAHGGWRYTYGVFAPPGAEGDRVRWTEDRGVAVVPVDAEWMLLDISAGHPDVEQHPVRAQVSVNGRRVADIRLRTHAALTRVVHVGDAPRAVIDVRADRTWRPPGTPDNVPGVGLRLAWTFASAPPPGAATVSAPGPR